MALQQIHSYLLLQIQIKSQQLHPRHVAISAKNCDWRKKSLGGSLSFMASFNGQKWSSRDFFSRREFFSRVENIFFEPVENIFFFRVENIFFEPVENIFFFESRIFSWSREFFHGVENFFMESRIFSWSRESCDRDDNFYLVSRLFLSSRELFLRVEF